VFIKGGAGCQLKKCFFFFPEAFRRGAGGVPRGWPFVENSPPAKEGCPKGGVVVSSSFSA